MLIPRFSLPQSSKPLSFAFYFASSLLCLLKFQLFPFTVSNFLSSIFFLRHFLSLSSLWFTSIFTVYIIFILRHHSCSCSIYLTFNYLSKPSHLRYFFFIPIFLSLISFQTYYSFLSHSFPLASLIHLCSIFSYTPLYRSPLSSFPCLLFLSISMHFHLYNLPKSWGRMNANDVGQNLD